MPFIAFSDRVQQRLVKPYVHSVVVKILGWNLGYRVLMARLKSIWSVTKGFSVVDLTHDYYLVRFTNAEAVEYVLIEGPWTVMGYYLVVQQWNSSFDVSTNRIDKIVAWIRLAEMNIHYYHKNIIRRLGGIVGPVIRIDYKTVEAQQGKYARMAVEIDLQKPLVSRFNFNGRVQKVEYEYMPTICFGCGKFGHYRDACMDADDIDPREKALPIPYTAVEIQANEATEKFGSWMVVTRRPRTRKANENSIPKNQKSSQKQPIFQNLRFGVLEAEIEEDSTPSYAGIAMDINHGNARSTLGNIQNLAPQSKNMKKKLNNIPNRKFPTRSESKSIIPKKTLPENLNLNF